MRFTDLQAWLSWQETLHSAEIELGLDRVRQVALSMGIEAAWSVPVITVAGTNGKGSSVAILEAIYHHAGYRVGSYTSPHLLNYNERIKINRQPVSDGLICQAFEQIDKARQLADAEDISLTYFEFGTLAALSILNDTEIDVVILEVGLGGRLDAVNIIDASVALITPIAIDHQSWLGESRNRIAAEKAGVMKPGSSVVYNDPDPAESVLQKALELGLTLYCLNQDFQAQSEPDSTVWQFNSDSVSLANLPLPSLVGRYQLNNAAAAIQVSRLLSERLPVTDAMIAKAMTDIRLQGRFQRLSQKPEIIVDVAHNAHAVSALAANLKQNKSQGRTLAVVAMLEDKAICDALIQVDSEIDRYYLAGLEGSRALSAEQIKQRIQECISSDKLCLSYKVEAALDQAISEAMSDDRIIIFGSFLTVSAAMQFLTETASGKLGS